MKLALLKNVACAHYAQLQISEDTVDTIAQNTKNTWQPDRGSGEMHSNTKQGKIAELIVEEFIRRYYQKQLSTLSYDKIRNDRNEKHAPFDLLIWRTGSTDIGPIVESIRADISNTRDEFVRLSDVTRRLCRETGVKIAEVKSTKIRPGLKAAAGFNGDYDDHVEVGRLLNTIMERDDIFCYPHYKREDAAPGYSMEDYCRFVKHCEPSLAMYNGELLRKKSLIWKWRNSAVML